MNYERIWMVVKWLSWRNIDNQYENHKFIMKIVAGETKSLKTTPTKVTFNFGMLPSIYNYLVAFDYSIVIISQHEWLSLEIYKGCMKRTQGKWTLIKRVQVCIMGLLREWEEKFLCKISLEWEESTTWTWDGVQMSCGNDYIYVCWREFFYGWSL